MQNFLIKVCGITNLRDAELSLANGANALGFNFYPKSPRYLETGQAVDLIQQLSGEFLSVAIIVVEKGIPLPVIPEEIRKVQVHGVDQESDLPSFQQATIAAVSPESINRFPSSEVIIDTSWGKGQTADWLALRKINRPYILSGGLKPDNIEDAIQNLRPAGIDVCSGIESRPGIKDEKLLTEFLERVLKVC